MMGWTLVELYYKKPKKYSKKYKPKKGTTSSLQESNDDWNTQRPNS